MHRHTKKVLCTLKDPLGRKTVKDMIKKISTRIYPVGRLDNMAEGMLLMTNDGDWANNIMHPRNKIKKTYLAKTTKELSFEEFERLKKGIKIDNTLVKPDRVVYLGKRLYRITLHQGLNRVVKRLFEALDKKVYALMRTQIGDLKLEGIKRGQFRHLTKKEVKALCPNA
jgi:23S rRNA pseudouridine2605 synthase